MYKCVHACVCACVRVHIYVCAHTLTHTHTHTYLTQNIIGDNDSRLISNCDIVANEEVVDGRGTSIQRHWEIES